MAIVVDEEQDDWDLHLLHVKLSYNNPASAVTGLEPNEVHMGRLPLIPLTSVDRTGVAGHRTLVRDHLAYCEFATDRQTRASDIVRAHYAFDVSRLSSRKSALTDALRLADARYDRSSTFLPLFLNA